MTTKKPSMFANACSRYGSASSSAPAADVAPVPAPRNTTTKERTAGDRLLTQTTDAKAIPLVILERAPVVAVAIEHISQSTGTGDLPMNTLAVDLETDPKKKLVLARAMSPNVKTDELYQNSERLYCVFPHAVEIPKEENARQVYVEFGFPHEAMTAGHIAVSHTHLASDGAIAENPTIYLDLDKDVIKDTLSKLLGGEKFDTLRQHATITSVRVVHAVNTLPIDLRMQFEYTSNQPTGNLRQTLFTPSGLCNRPSKPTVVKERDCYHSRNAAKQSHFASTLYSGMDGAPLEELSTPYNLDDMYSAHEARRWIGVDGAALQAEIASLRKLSNDTSKVIVDCPVDQCSPKTLSQYIILSHSEDMKLFTAAEVAKLNKAKRDADPSITADAYDVESYLPKLLNCGDNGETHWVVHQKALAELAIVLVDDYRRFAVNLSAPLRVALTLKYGAESWKSLAMLGNSAPLNMTSQRISVLLAIKFVPLDSQDEQSEAMKKDVKDQHALVARYRQQQFDNNEFLIGKDYIDAMAIAEPLNASLVAHLKLKNAQAAEEKENERKAKEERESKDAAAAKLYVQSSVDEQR